MKAYNGIIFTLFFLLATNGFLSAFEPVEITDCLNRKVLLEKSPERIIITGRAGFMISNAAFFFSNAPEKLLSYSKNFQMKNSDEFYKLIDKKFQFRQFTDHTTGIEEIAAMKPDLILAKDFEAVRLERSCSQLGVPILFFNLESPKSFYSDISNLGAIFSQPEQAQQVINFFKTRQNKIRDQLAELKPGKLPSALLLFYSERGGPTSFNVSPATWIQAELIRLAGAEPVWLEAAMGNGWQKIGFDQIAAWNPDFIFITSYFGDTREALRKIKADPLWQLMSAVKKNQIFAFPEDYVSWDQPDSRWILGLSWLAATMNPELKVLKTDMHQLFIDFYKLYGIDEKQGSQIKITGDYF